MSTGTRSRKWSRVNECAEPFSFRPRRYPLLSSGRRSSGTFRRKDDGMITRSDVQGGKVPCTEMAHTGMHNVNRMDRALNG